MASVIKRPKGHRWVQYIHDGRRHTLRLGQVSLATARDIKHHVERLIESSDTGAPLSTATRDWLGSIGLHIRMSLERHGLLEPTGEVLHPRDVSVQDLTEYALMQYAQAKPNTRRNIKYALDWLLKYFRAERRINTITPGDVSDWRRWLVTQGLGPTTISEIIRKTRTVFKMAIDKRWLEGNPLHGQRDLVATDVTRQYFVTAETIALVIEHCEPEWQLIIALARFGGLRAPSEVMHLRWEMIDLPGGRMSVFSPKLARHDGGMRDNVPIFAELHPFLVAAWERAEDGAQYVITAHRSAGDKALYSAFRKRILRAAVKPWPKLFTNLRSSRETELVERFPPHVVTAWLGNSPEIARKHYLQVTKTHFDDALQGAAQSEAASPKKHPAKG